MSKITTSATSAKEDEVRVNLPTVDEQIEMIAKAEDEKKPLLLLFPKKILTERRRCCGRKIPHLPPIPKGRGQTEKY